MRAGYVAEVDGVMVGMVGVDDLGSIPLVMVRPRWQRRGIGRQLIGAALARLHQAKVGAVGLGSAGGQYIWPHVPENLPGAVALFAQTGWAFTHVSVNMVRDLGDFHTPRPVWERIQPLGLAIQTVGAGALRQSWRSRSSISLTGLTGSASPDKQILAASTTRKGIVASLLLEGPGSSSVFAPMLGADMGSIGCAAWPRPIPGRCPYLGPPY